MSHREFLIEPIAYLAPQRVLDGLTAELAEARVLTAPHSIGEIVAHMAFWQDWFSERCAGRPAPVVTSAAQGWPEVVPGAWPKLHERFLNRLQQLAGIGEERARAPLSPAIEFPPLAHYTVGDALTHVATHNAHHLGQIVLLRQLQRAWPPPGGGWTW